MVGAVHTREEHILCILVFRLIAYYFVAVFFIRIFLFLALVYRGTFRYVVYTASVYLFQGRLGCVCLSVEQRTGTVLFTSQIFSQGEDVFRRVLIHRRIGRGADDDYRIRRISYYNHHHCQQGSVQGTGTYTVFFRQVHEEISSQYCQYQQTDEYAAPSVSVKRNTQQCDSQQEGKVHPLLAAYGKALVYTPDKAGCQYDDIHNQSCVERESQAVDKEQFKPSSYLYDTRNDTVKYGGHQNHGAYQGNQTALEIGIRVLLVIINQYNGRNTQQIQQVYTDRKSCKISN